jgi:hypothetical protein
VLGPDVPTSVVTAGTVASDATPVFGRLERLWRCDAASLPVAPAVPAAAGDPEVVPRAALSAELRLLEAVAPPEESTPDDLTPPVGEAPSWFELEPACDPGREERGALFVAPLDGDESDDVDPVDPGEPLGSANAIGIATTAEPTPNATASAPTRPT